MAQSQRKTVRKLVTLPQELAERVDKFRQEISAASESDALKMLIEDGLKLRDRPSDLYHRFEAATRSGETIGSILTIASEHPLVESAFINGNEAVIHLKETDPKPQKFVFDRTQREWDWLEQIGGYGPDDGWESILKRPAPQKRATRDELDDEIPF